MTIFDVLFTFSDCFKVAWALKGRSCTPFDMSALRVEVAKCKDEDQCEYSPAHMKSTHQRY